jgi:hypothetical protein
MKRNEMLLKLENTMDSALGTDPETGQTLYPPSSYLAFLALKCVEDNGMLPPETIRYKDLPGGNTFCCEENSWEE